MTFAVADLKKTKMREISMIGNQKKKKKKKFFLMVSRFKVRIQKSNEKRECFVS